MTKISKSELFKIHNRWLNGETLKNIADDYGVTQTTLSLRLKRAKGKLFVNIVKGDDFLNPIAKVALNGLDVSEWVKYQEELLKKFFKTGKADGLYDVHEGLEAGMSIDHFTDMIKFLSK